MLKKMNHHTDDVLSILTGIMLSCTLAPKVHLYIPSQALTAFVLGVCGAVGGYCGKEIGVHLFAKIIKPIGVTVYNFIRSKIKKS